MRRRLLKALAALALLIVLVVAGVYVYMRQSLPAVDG